MNYFPQRLKSARLMNGLSLQALADRMHNRITKQALSKYEQGQMMPSSEIVGLLSEALQVRPDYFYSETEVTFGEIEFRKLKKYSAKEKQRIIEITRDILRRYIELEELLGIESRFDNPLGNISIPIVKNYSDALLNVEAAADQLRQVWNLGGNSIGNVIELLEDHHIKVIEVESNVELDGFSTYVNDNIPVIVLNKSKLDEHTDRKRWTALHELGHLLLSDLASFSERNKEKLCHYFAGAVLFPEEAMKAELGERRTKLSLNELGALKQQYGISMQAIVYRAKELGIVNENYFKQFFFMFRQMGYKEKEPVEYKGLEESTRFKQLLFRALAEEIISMSKAAALNNQKLADFRKENLVI
ncbi:MAG: helix-turn-helix domain-containing protein [Cyclobacteriaceae bacterium]